jgi:Extensin-like protein C-terminus
MTRGVCWYLVGSLVLVALTGCKPTWFEEREPWRHEAEESCLKTGAVKESPSVVLLGPINGPGMCGADFPLKVGALGEAAPLGYADEALRPPSDVPGGPASYPRQPAPSAYPADAPFAVNPAYPADTRLPPNSEYRAAPVYRPPPQYPSNPPFAVNPAYPADTRLPPNSDYQPPEPYEPAPPYPDARRAPPRYSPTAPYPRPVEPNGPVSLTAPGIDPPGGDREGDYQAPLPRYGAPRTVPARNVAPARAAPAPANVDEPPARPDPRARAAPFPSRYPGGGDVVPMSPSRMASAATTAAVSPPATLACPIVSALDRWIGEAVQPAAQKWFGQPVTGIRQISAYSCRGMNGNPNAHISEHAFGNALDISAFELADGRKITVQQGWHGSPEEQGFLHDIQAAACELFTTVLAPGSNVYHYNHIHVDLMRRSSGRHICQPGAIAGDVVAARVRTRYGSRDTGVTGSISSRRGDRHGTPYSSYTDEDRGLPDAVPGED